MYFDYDKKIDICGLINKNYEIYAHKKEGENEKLEAHTNLSVKYFLKIVKEKNLIDVFQRIEEELLKNISLKGQELFKEMILNTITLHDIGKVNPYFQKNRLDNNLNIKGCSKYKNSHHSLLSSIVYMDIYFPKIRAFKCEERNILLDFMLMNSYVISRHHGGLSSFKDFKRKFDLDKEGQKLIEEQKILSEVTLNNKIKIKVDYVKKIFEIAEKEKQNYSKEQLVCRYIYERLILSLLIASDFYSTSEYMEEIEIKDIGIINNIEEFYGVYKKGKIYKSIREYEKKEYGMKNDFTDIKDINILRDELFLDAEKKLEDNIESNIFYLEAPTGSGKSNAATNLSFRLLQEDKRKNKIFYVYPFNTLVEQNINTLSKVFEKEKEILNKIAVINSIEPIKMDKEILKSEDTNLDYYRTALLNRQFLNYPMVLTTHVTIFKYLFGTSKENIFPVHQLANSIVVLDEIQSYRNLIWGEIITFLTSYAKILNIKLIIMSATLPDLDKLSLSSGNTVKLIDKREKYFENPIFKNRVNVDYSFLESKDIIEDLYSHVKKNSFKNKKILIEFISKNSAYNFYNKLKEDDEVSCSVELMSGDDNIGERDRIIKKVKEKDSMILVATQVVEAGVDIDMDVGYKNISMLDSEEQFLGRVNRSCKKNGSIVYFFKLDEAKNVYKDRITGNSDIRINNDITLENDSIRNFLREKNFNEFYDLVIERLKNLTSGLNELNIDDFFYNEVGKLNFKEVEDRLRLIQDNESKISVYLSNSELIVKDEKLNGEELWNKYKELLCDKDMDYSERKVKLSEVRSKMNNFIYEISWNNDFPYNDRLGELYFIEDGDKYFKEGKLDKEKFISGIGDFI